MDFTKMHGSGNDYVYVNAYQHDMDWPEVARKVSDRHTGIGADGLIIAMPSEAADLRMRMFNLDGSEGEMCGNGIRCFVAFAMQEGLINVSPEIKSIETGSGILSVTPEFKKGSMVGATVNMGEPILNPVKIPVDIPYSDWPVLDYPLEVGGYELELSFVSMGNPHAIAFIDQDVDEFPLEQIGPDIEKNPIFPNKVNFEVVNRVTGNRLKARVWERGSGITLACGTGACALVVAARLKNLVSADVEVELPGGVLTISWVGDGDVMMQGPVKMVYRGNWLDGREYRIG